MKKLIAIVASSHPHGLFAEVTSEGKEYHYCNGELHIVYDEKGNEIFRRGMISDIRR